MRTILGFVPVLICIGAMVVCARMAMNHASSERTQTPLSNPEAEVHDG